MVCPYYNQVAKCRYHLNKDGSINGEHKKKFCDIDDIYVGCLNYQQIEIRKQENVQKHGPVKGIELTFAEINAEANIRDRLDGLI